MPTNSRLKPARFRRCSKDRYAFWDEDMAVFVTCLLGRSGMSATFILPADSDRLVQASSPPWTAMRFHEVSQIPSGPGERQRPSKTDRAT